MFAAPVDPAGVTQVSELAEMIETDVQAEPPTVTVAPAAKPLPLTVIVVPPPVGPEVGEADVTVGAGLVMLSAVSAPVEVPLQCVKSPPTKIFPLGSSWMA